MEYGGNTQTLTMWLGIGGGGMQPGMEEDTRGMYCGNRKREGERKERREGGRKEGGKEGRRKEGGKEEGGGGIDGALYGYLVLMGPCHTASAYPSGW